MKDFKWRNINVLKAMHLRIFMLIVFFIFLAPNIYENEDIKKGILLQLFGGTKKDFSSKGKGNFR